MVDQFAGNDLWDVSGEQNLSMMILTSSAAFWIASPILGSIPYPIFTIEAAFFTTPKALINGGGSLSDGPPISKF